MQPLLRVLLLALAAAPHWAPAENKYQLSGRIVQDDGRPFTTVTPVVFLHGAITPYSAQTRAGLDGRFTFKNLPAATYTLIVDVPRTGEMRKTIEVGPSFADSRGRISLTVKFDRPTSIEKDAGVSAAELSVPQNALREYEKAGECLARRDVQGAIRCLEKATEIAPQYAAAWNFLGTISYQTKRYKEAEKYFREALERDPEAYSPLVNLGGALLSQGRIEESLPVNERAVTIRPDDPLAHSQLGQSCYFLGKLDEAERHLKQAKALEPGHFTGPQLVLAEIYWKKNQPAAAIAELEEFLKLHPDSEMAPRLRKVIEAARARK